MLLINIIKDFSMKSQLSPKQMFFAKGRLLFHGKIRIIS